MMDEKMYREIALKSGDQDAEIVSSALRDSVSDEGLEIYQNLAGIASALSEIIEPGKGLAILSEVDPDDDTMLSVRLIGIEATA